MKTFVISDTHFWHENIIKYANRPFADVDEMNAELIARWNAVVSNDDMVIHLGDVSFQFRRAEEVMSQLNRGRLVLVCGNHDRSNLAMYKIGVDEILCKKRKSATIQFEGRTIIMAHEPTRLPLWNTTESINAVRLCGHVHDQGRWLTGVKALNMSCEEWNYTPVQIEVVINEFDEAFRSHV